MCSPLTLLSVKLPTYPQMYRLEGSYFYIVIKLLMFVYRSPNRRPLEVVEWREYVDTLVLAYRPEDYVLRVEDLGCRHPLRVTCGR